MSFLPEVYEKRSSGCCSSIRLWDSPWVAIGASAGALAGSLTDYCINDGFIQSLAETFSNNS
jgi:hypothetical protein